jgi:5-methyltetrahydrofolate--homocysteine methyltransferase
MSTAAEFTEWRGYDLRLRVAKLKRAFRCEPVTSPDDMPVFANSPCYFAFGTLDKPADYFTNPAAMYTYQADGFEQHLARVDDDLAPYFMPWFGTGVLASAFGCEIKITEGLAGAAADDPAVAGACIHSPADAARLRLPDLRRAGWMPRVLDAIDYARAEGDLPVGLTDMQGPLDTLGLMCGQAQLYQWMYKEPAMIHELFDLVTAAFIEWVKLQKEHIGEPLNSSNGLQGVHSPGIGIWESDDDAILLDAALYRDFVAESVSAILDAFGGGSVHFCGNGVHQLDTLLAMPNLRVINNSPLGDFRALGALKRRLNGRVTLEIQDGAPLNVESYYRGLFSHVDDLAGVILAPFVTDKVAMDDNGGYVPIDWDPFETANRIARTARACAAQVLSGELREEKAAQAFVPAVAPEKVEPKPSSALTAQQSNALYEIQDRLLEFDDAGVQAAVRAALDTGLRPFDIVLLGMAEGMNEVGKLYESGEFFLPQLVMAGNTMKKGMAVLGPLLKQDAAGAGKGRVVLGTVKGDLHDIGKNLVGIMLEGAGFTLIDLGVDVPPQRFIDAAREHEADIIALSALLTTTMPSMRLVVEALVEAGLRRRVKVMIGGAPISRTFADQIGAEGYASDAIKAIREAERLMEQVRAGAEKAS